MTTGRLGRGLRSAAVFILLIVLGDSAMTSVRSEEATKPAVTVVSVSNHIAQFRALASHASDVQAARW